MVYHHDPCHDELPNIIDIIFRCSVPFAPTLMIYIYDYVYVYVYIYILIVCIVCDVCVMLSLSPWMTTTTPTTPPIAIAFAFACLSVLVMFGWVRPTYVEGIVCLLAPQYFEIRTEHDLC